MSEPKKNKKKGVRVLDSDQDYLGAFLSNEMPRKTRGGAKDDGTRKNRHGLPFVEDYETRFIQEEDRGETAETSGARAPDRDQYPQTEPVDEISEEDFAALLEASFKNKTLPKKKSKPVPLKKRLNRYPGPEAELDLHGFTAFGAEVKARAFLSTAMVQGFFTVRIIVGRGLHSEEGAVLPHVVEDLVRGMKKDKTILSYKWEGKGKQRGGALIVYLNQFND